MPGLWTVHRRPKVNLNALDPPSLQENPNVSEAAEPLTASATQSIDAVLIAGPSEAKPTSSAKRKVRPSRNTEEGTSNKRARVPGSSGGTIAKDYAPPTTRLSDLGGVESCIEKLLELVAMPLCHPEIYIHTGVQSPRGVLLHGPPGCGKTMLANAIAGVRPRPRSLSVYLNSDRRSTGIRCSFHQHICAFRCVWNVRRI